MATPKRMQSLTQKSLSVFEKSRKQIVTDGQSFVTAPKSDFKFGLAVLEMGYMQILVISAVLTLKKISRGLFFVTL